MITGWDISSILFGGIVAALFSYVWEGRMLLLGVAVLNYCIFSAFRRMSPLPPFDLLLLGLASLFRFLGAATFAYAFYYLISVANVYSQLRELSRKGAVDRYLPVQLYYLCTFVTFGIVMYAENGLFGALGAVFAAKLLLALVYRADPDTLWM